MRIWAKNQPREERCWRGGITTDLKSIHSQGILHDRHRIIHSSQFVENVRQIQQRNIAVLIRHKVKSTSNAVKAMQVVAYDAPVETGQVVQNPAGTNFLSTKTDTKTLQENASKHLLSCAPSPLSSYEHPEIRTRPHNFRLPLRDDTNHILRTLLRWLRPNPDLDLLYPLTIANALGLLNSYLYYYLRNAHIWCNYLYMYCNGLRCDNPVCASSKINKY